ncbi:hypothetical protein SMICM17S_11524 [Streptomyces microflavus]
MPLALQEELPEAALRKYDLIGFDPRGVGRSTPVTWTDSEEENWLRPYKKETFTKDVAWARKVADKCREKSGAVLPHITTRNTARDVDLLRAVLGEKKISYLGYSYGTYLGAVYTQLFPGRADRFVLDSAVDPARAWRGMVQWWAEGAEPAFDRWTGGPPRVRRTYGLGDTPKKVDRTFWEVVAPADEQPIELEWLLISGDDIRGGMRGAGLQPAVRHRGVRGAEEGRGRRDRLREEARGVHRVRGHREGARGGRGPAGQHDGELLGCGVR